MCQYKSIRGRKRLRIMRERKILERAAKATHVIIRWECPLCDKQYIHRGHLALHLKKQHRFCGTSYQLKCNMCGQIFCTQIAFENHKLKSMDEMKGYFEETNKVEKKRQKHWLLALQHCEGKQFLKYLNEFKIKRRSN